MNKDKIAEIRIWHADVDMRFDDKPSKTHQDREVLLSEIDTLQAEVERLRKAHEAACGGDELLRAAFTRLLDRLTRERDEARAEVERLHRAHQAACEGGDLLRATLLAEVERLRAVLDQLARLGNEPNYGTSFGNVMARNALEAKL